MKILEFFFENSDVQNYVQLWTVEIQKLKITYHAKALKKSLCLENFVEIF